MARVTGIGGVFLRAKDPKALTLWYVEHLGLQISPHGAVELNWSEDPNAATATTAWCTFPADTAYFGSSGTAAPQSVMINYRVDDIDALLAKLAAAGVPIDPHREDHEYGRFAWVTDPEGNRLELWQPLP